MRINIQSPKLFKEVLSSSSLPMKLSKFNGISIDSRKIEPGDIFIAMKGASVDGHDFINQAQNAGAIACIAENNIERSNNIFQVKSTRDFLNKISHEYRKKLNCKIIGITGSNGKTTTKDLLSHVLSGEKTMSTRGNYNSTIGAPLSIFECDEEDKYSIIEMGASRPNEIENICNIIKPNMGLITNIFESHIEYFSSINEIAKTKSALFKSLGNS